MESSKSVEVSWARSDPAVLRAHHLADALEREGPPAPGVREEVLAEEGAFRGGLLFTPPDPAAAVIVYFHGGGFIAGSPRTHRCVTSWLAALTGLRILSARYRLAPEHRYPAQREDGLAACTRAAALAGSAKILLCGDSAGACIALATLRGLPAALRARVAGLALLYGAYGLTESASIARHGTAANGLDSETLRSYYRRLLGEGASLTPAGLAAGVREPVFLLAAELDAVFDDSCVLREALEDQGTPCRFQVAVGQDHGFLKETGKTPAALAALERVAAWMKEANVG